MLQHFFRVSIFFRFREKMNDWKKLWNVFLKITGKEKKMNLTSSTQLTSDSQNQPYQIT